MLKKSTNGKSQETALEYLRNKYLPEAVSTKKHVIEYDPEILGAILAKKSMRKKANSDSKTS